jgi:pimeloyl-ACP methyl ester carboxylesterase
MSTPTLHFVNCPDALGNPEVKITHRVAYHEWGDPANPHVVLCVHGLTRQGRDFDVLARALAPHRRVVCVDVAGRAQSVGAVHKMQGGCAHGVKARQVTSSKAGIMSAFRTL